MGSSLQFCSMILGYGNPVMDASCAATREELAGLQLSVGVDGAIGLDDAAKQRVIEHCLAHPAVSYTPGGTALNAVRVAQACLGTAGSTGFVGAVAADALGERLQRLIAEGGVSPTLQVVDGPDSTGYCAVLVCENDRALAGLPGAASRLSSSFVEAKAPLIDGARCVCIV